jgi:type IV pilus assembly protein PilV
MKKIQPNRKPQSGMTLIEVLVSILIFSFGILGMVGLLARASQFSVDAEDRNRASLLANEIASAMWTAGSVNNLPPADLAAWTKRVGDPQAGGLINGTGRVDVVGTGNGAVATIEVTWRHPGRKAEDKGSTNRYVTQVVIQ